MRQMWMIWMMVMCTGMTADATAQPIDQHHADVTYTAADSAEIVALLNSGETTATGFAEKFIGRPYIAHTLEVNKKEKLVVNTQELDCTTLVETVTALTLCAQNGKRTFAEYCDMLQKLRYRQGILNGYTSRLHYFSDWIEDKTAMGLVSEVQMNTAPFTAIQQLNINYMSQHPNAYTALKREPALVKTIAQQERKLTGRRYRYIPKRQVRNTTTLRNAVHDGDIIAITCKKPGLDIAHLGFAVWKQDGLHLLNASQLHRKVVLEPMTLETYLAKHPTHTGIRIVRINPESK